MTKKLQATMTVREKLIVREALNQGAARLANHDCPNTDPDREAQALLTKALGLDAVRLAVEPNRPLSAQEQGEYDRLLTRRVRHWPLAYLLETAPFLDFSLRVTPDTLIPRPATETLAQAMMAELEARPAETVIDIGTGAGGLAIAAARSGRPERVLATDRSAAALAVARQNAKRLAPPTCLVRFFHGDLLDPVAAEPGSLSARPTATEKTLLVANLPYLPESHWPDLSPDIREHEPREALTSGPDGLNHYRRLIDQLSTLVPPENRPGLRLLFELLPEQYPPVSDLTTGKLGLASQPVANENGTVVGLMAKDTGA